MVGVGNASARFPSRGGRVLGVHGGGTVHGLSDVVLTTEEEGVGLVAGAALGGQRAALLMQSGGGEQLHQYVFAVAQLRLRLRRLGHHAR